MSGAAGDQLHLGGAAEVDDEHLPAIGKKRSNPDEVRAVMRAFEA